MFQEQFTKLEPAAAASVLDHINPKLDTLVFDPAETTILAIDLPFYPGWQFLDIADYSPNPPVRVFAVHNPDSRDTAVLDWSNAPIYRLNDELPITLDAQTVETYVKFFFTHVRGKHGRFMIVENVDDIAWKEDPPPAARRAIGKMLSPVTLQGRAEGAWHLKACLLFRDSLFRADIYVEPDGRTRIANEELIIEDMPVLDDVFGQ